MARGGCKDCRGIDDDDDDDDDMGREKEVRRDWAIDGGVSLGQVCGKGRLGRGVGTSGPNLHIASRCCSAQRRSQLRLV